MEMREMRSNQQTRGVGIKELEDEEVHIEN
jgi:hypothetical protein